MASIMPIELYFVNRMGNQLDRLFMDYPKTILGKELGFALARN
jgi:hypothetical protein